MFNPDKIYFTIACSNCGKEVKESLAWFKDNSSFPCPNCSFVFNVCEKKIVMALNNFEHSVRNHGF